MASQTQRRYEVTPERAVDFTLQVYGVEKGLGVTRCLDTHGTPMPLYAVTHMASGLKLRSFKRLTEARAVLKLLLPLRDWTVPAAELQNVETADAVRAVCPL